MARVRVTWRDDKAPHQIRIVTAAGNGGKVFVTCTCRQVTNGFRDPGYSPMGELLHGDSPFKLYDDPANHRVNKGVEFKPGDRTTQEMYNLE